MRDSPAYGAWERIEGGGGNWGCDLTFITGPGSAGRSVVTCRFAGGGRRICALTGARSLVGWPMSAR